MPSGGAPAAAPAGVLPAARAGGAVRFLTRPVRGSTGDDRRAYTTGA